MTTPIDIGKLITIDPQNNRPVISGTRTSVRRIAGLYNQGNNAEEISRRLNHLNIAQIYAALTYYHTNRLEIDQDIADEQAAYEELAKKHSTEGKQSGLLTDSVVMTDNLATIVTSAVYRVIGSLPTAKIDKALKYTLGL